MKALVNVLFGQAVLLAVAQARGLPHGASTRIQRNGQSLLRRNQNDETVSYTTPSCPDQQFFDATFGSCRACSECFMMPDMEQCQAKCFVSSRPEDLVTKKPGSRKGRKGKKKNRKKSRKARIYADAYTSDQTARVVESPPESSFGKVSFTRQVKQRMANSVQRGSNDELMQYLSEKSKRRLLLAKKSDPDMAPDSIEGKVREYKSEYQPRPSDDLHSDLRAIERQLLLEDEAAAAEEAARLSTVSSVPTPATSSDSFIFGEKRVFPSMEVLPTRSVGAPVDELPSEVYGKVQKKSPWSSAKEEIIHNEMDILHTLLNEEDGDEDSEHKTADETIAKDR